MSSSTCLPCRALCQFWQSSIGKKLVVALTGAFLVLFLAGHLVGNMLIYQGSEAFNHYAHFLHTMLHGWGIWLFRLTMLAALGLHIVATVQLVKANRAARPSRYQADDTMVASKSSRIMIYSGLTILVFFVFHILHYTVRVTGDLKVLAEFGQNWAMTVKGFQNPIVVIFYVLAMGLLCSHLSHGVASIFQTLGLRSRKTEGLISLLSKGYAIVLFVGFSSIPVACLFGFGKKEMNTTTELVDTLQKKGYCELPELLEGRNLTEYAREIELAPSIKKKSGCSSCPDCK
ncbi:succinate dehydrogenase cytochrome b subunit [Verrucomicrobiaceae bacterium N1E253]|uniref:Succinate dehydrogenase cytochrome b subunit n=1 Tax=Oceaniferula marina TaxID=2748318 RepID=A0A851G9L2_9BACT|nr:succinate dehydrogenase cytochrome b subunit [Oceaniferula marina]NWK54293.1 succinate dehydrogenase cytochrome b subunit [Oceaniferula marina]